MTTEVLARLCWLDGHINHMNVDVTSDHVIIPSSKGNRWFKVMDEIDDKGCLILVEEKSTDSSTDNVG
jgi:hypothetical protein